MGLSNLAFVALSMLCLQGVYCSSNLYGPLHDALLRMVDPSTIPILEKGSSVEVQLKVSLVKVLDVDEENDEVEILAWEMYSWNDFTLQWDPSEFQGLTNLRLPHDSIWRPDVALYNSVKAPEMTTPKMVVVSHTGDVFYVPSVRLRFYCNLSNLDSSTGATCSMKYGSWTYDSFLLNFTQPNPHNDFDMNEYLHSKKYTVTNTFVEKDTVYYTCCPEPYEDLKFKFNIKKNGNNFFSSIF